ncbi:MAG: hypothetical protein HY465_03760 [Deltaproteobacteria bacterium]|nr:hypothetical protein [Deltaproteobacteria bacterium]
MMNHRIQSVIVVVITAILAACAPSGDADIEAARFALDSGDYSTAITKATAALTADTTDVDAAMVLSSAYAGRAGVRLLSVTADISDTGNTENEFEAIHDALIANVAVDELPDLRAAITTLTTTLTAEPAATDDLYEDFNFQLGSLQAIEIFAAPSITAQPSDDESDIDSTRIDETSDTETDKVEILADFIDVDNRLIAAGMTADDDLVDILRKNYCVLHDLSAGDGIDLGVLRDQIECQLAANADTVTTTAALVANCAAFATEFDECASPGATTADAAKF